MAKDRGVRRARAKGPPGRIILLSASLALAGGGVGAVIGLPSFVAISSIFLLTIVGESSGLGSASGSRTSRPIPGLARPRAQPA